MLHLPPAPKLLSLRDVQDLKEASRRTDEWARAAQALLEALRKAGLDQDKRLTVQEARELTASGGVSDHGGLTGLGGDDHTQYLRTDGTRALTGNQAAGGNKITGLAAATANGDAVRYEQLSATRAVWDARVVPSGLHAASDEFLTDTIANWNEWDPNAISDAAIDTTYRELRLEVSGTAAQHRHVARYKAVPSNEFTFLARATMDRSPLANVAPTATLCVGQDFAGAPTTSDIAAGFFTGPVLGSAGATFGTYAAGSHTTAPTATSHQIGGFTSVWMRGRVLIVPGTSTRLDVDYSSDGEHWMPGPQINTAYAALHFGVGAYVGFATIRYVTFSHFRVWDGTSAFFGSRNGGYLA